MRSILLFAGSLIAAGVDAAPAVAEDPRERFLTDYTSHAAAVRDAYTNVYGSLQVKHFTHKGRMCFLETFKFKYNFRNSMVESTGVATTEDGRSRDVARDMTVQNTRYGFDLRGDKTSGKEAMFGYRVADARSLPWMCRMCFPYANQIPAGRSYLEVVRSPATRVTEYADLSWRGQTVRQVVTEFATPHPATAKPYACRMGYMFRPDQRWVCVGVRGYSLNEPGKVEWEDAYDYGPPTDGWPTPTAGYRQMYRDTPDPSGRREFEFTVTEFRRAPAPFPDDEFTLSHFGYPEPDNLPAAAGEPPPLLPIDADALAPPRPRPWLPAGWLWAAAGLAAAGVLGFLVRRRLAARRAVP